MALIVFTAVSGTRGLTTTVVGLGLTWPRPVIVVEADPSGGSQMLAGHFRGLARPGLSELVLAHRQHQLAKELPARLFPAADSHASFLPGIRSPLQGPTMVGVWDELLRALRGQEASTGADVLIDAGRLGLVGSPDPLMTEADFTVVLSGSGLPELACLRAWLPWLRRGVTDLRLLLQEPGRPYSAAEVERDLEVPVIGAIPWDPRAARWWSHGEPHRAFDRTPLARAVRALGESLRAVPVQTVAPDRADVASELGSVR
jgi:hypothetical protein